MKSVSTTQVPLVLAVCEDRALRELVKETLASAGVEVWAGATIEEAFRTFRGPKPVLIIADLHLPGVGAMDFCRMPHSPAYPELNDVPVLMVSASAHGSEAADLAGELGAADFFALPDERLRLAERVRALIANPSGGETWRVLLALAGGPELAELRESFSAQHQARVCHLAGVAEIEVALAEEDWDTVVCDLDLPGLDLARVSAWASVAPRTAFVTVASSLDPAGSVASLRAGAGAHLRRPFAADYLVGISHLVWQKVGLVRARQLLERRTFELRQSERRLQGVLDSSEQIFLVLDARGHVELFNDAACRICASLSAGRPRRGEHLAGILPEELRRLMEPGFARALGGEVLQHDADVTDREGRRRRFIVRYAPLSSLDDAAPQVCFNAYDITDRAEAEDTLRLRNQALSSVSQGVMITGPDRRILYVNEGFSAITGYAPAEVVGRSCRFLHGPGTDPTFSARLRRTLEAGFSMEGEVLNYRKDGTEFWNDLIITPVKNARGETTQYVGVQRDITERKRQQDALAASQARLQALFDHSHDAILLTDDHARLLAVNPAACAMLGYAGEELVGAPLLKVFESADHEWAGAAWRDLMAKGRMAGECGLRRRDGAPVRVEYHAIARIQPGVHLSILRDVTDHHNLQSRLLRQQRLESVGRLASGVAHDLNNILTPILMAPAILRPYLSEASARMLLDTVEAGARRGSFIVRQLMTFARGEAGEKVPLDLRDIVNDVGGIIRETFRKDILLDISSGARGSRFPVLGDPNQLHQAVLNLALNAADAMSRGGRMVIALERADVSAADIAAEPGAQAGPHALVSVVDHGVGVAPEHLDKIFDPFFTTKPFGQGSGLGLSVVLGIARGHGGFARVSSRPGVGTIAKLYLPLQREAVSASGSASPIPPASDAALAGRVVLVVDDEAAVRDVVRSILSRAGCKVLCAAGADAAFSQIQASGGRIDLVLTDLAMPAVSGATFIEMLRGRRPDLPVLVLTGTDIDEELPKSIRAHVRAVIGKPCDAATLISAVERALSRGVRAGAPKIPSKENAPLS